MSKLSVKKPFTVLVLVAALIMVGAVSLSKMQMDLLPEISLPYILVITTYPGASPEKVESTIAEPMESALGTISGIENVYSMSYENYCMVQLEFADGTDMDSVLVKVSTALDTVKSSLPDECGIPSIMELSTDMMASQYLAVGYEGKDMDELSKFVQNNVIPEIERQNGVANVDSMGMIEKTVQVELNQDKVDILNAKIQGKAQDALDEAAEKFDDAKEQLEDSEKQLEEGKQQLYDSQKELNNAKQELIDGQKELDDGRQELADAQKELDDAKQKLEDGKTELEDKSKETYEKLAEASEGLEALETYQAELLILEAQLKVIDEQLGGFSQDDLDKMVKVSAVYSETDIQNFLVLYQIQRTVNDLVNPNVDPTLPAETPLSYTIVPGQPSLIDQSVAIATALEGKATVTQLKAITADSTLGDLQAAIDETLGSIKSFVDVSVDENLMRNSIMMITKANVTMDVMSYKAAIEAAEKALEEAGVDYKDIEVAKMQAAAGFGSADAQMVAGQAQLDAAQAQLDSAVTQLDTAQTQLDNGWDQIADGQKQINDAWDQMADGEQQIADGWDSYYDGLDQFAVQSEQALRSANANQLITLEALAGLIYAQNFSMPAGYIDDAEDNSWLLKIGDNFANINDLENMVLVHIDDVGDVKLGDVADITIIDNSATTFTRLNGGDAVILSVFKSSTSGTNEVSKQCRTAIEKLEKQYPGLNILVMMDQGDYIEIIVGSVVSNMVVGATLAIIILALFLKDFKPTIVVAISIPLSVLTALVAMYFSGISLNMMSLSGMALGIGMLVDNSIVVIENIYRLRSRNVEAPRAAVQGTRQVSGSVIASTLTTVCVFLPMVYTSGLVRELMLPMSLTIVYCILASLLIAMTVVPAASSTLLRKAKPKKHPWFDKVQDVYGEVLAFCLKVKIVPLAVAVLLLAFSIWQVARMGIVIIPEMTSNQIEGNITIPEETSREEAYATVDEYLARAYNIEGIGSIGVMTGNGSALLASSGNNDNYLQYSLMIKTEDEKAGADVVNRIVSELNAAAEGLNMELSVSTGMGDMGALVGSGLSISIYGDDMDKLLEISKDLMAVIGTVEGFEEISNGQEEADQVLHLNINRDYAMSKGLSIAQIYQTIAGKMTTSTDSVSIVLDGEEMKVKIVTELDPLTVENLLDYNLEINDTDDWGNTIKVDMPLREIATIETQDGFSDIQRKNNARYITVTATAAEGENITLLSRELQPLIDNFELPEGYTLDMGGETESVNEMVSQMALLMLMGCAFIYFVMVAQFQSLLSPFIVLFTLPLAFTGGLLILWMTGEQISIIALMGFVVLLGTVVNNGIVFVDYTNQLRIGGMPRKEALIATGKTRMRPILMTALTTILAESSMIFGDDMGSQMGKGMALVIAGGLAYSTLMTLFIIPVMYDILFKKAPLAVDLGSENLDDVPDDAQEFMQEILAKKAEKKAETAKS